MNSNTIEMIRRVLSLGIVLATLGLSGCDQQSQKSKPALLGEGSGAKQLTPGSNTSGVGPFLAKISGALQGGSGDLVPQADPGSGDSSSLPERSASVNGARPKPDAKSLGFATGAATDGAGSGVEIPRGGPGSVIPPEESISTPTVLGLEMQQADPSLESALPGMMSSGDAGSAGPGQQYGSSLPTLSPSVEQRGPFDESMLSPGLRGLPMQQADPNLEPAFPEMMSSGEAGSAGPGYQQYRSFPTVSQPVQERGPAFLRGQ